MATKNRMLLKSMVDGKQCALQDWIAQRLTGVIIAVYTIILLVKFFFAHDFSYRSWTLIFTTEWMKISTFAMMLSLSYHAWIGVRNILMDYIKSLYIRFILQLLSIVWLLICSVYTIQILWRI
ncbi:MAG: succinate dehydrogenase, hydrophobic membrane anchor protein [Burkholderia sp.]|nr:succinate dehydrogenase, hydrophobic membrane anchor protein [Burkholderia sp.]